jgi:hypothetical protein
MDAGTKQKDVARFSERKDRCTAARMGELAP